QEVSLPPVNFLARVVAMFTADLRRLGGLTIDHPRTRFWVTSRFRTHLATQGIVNADHRSVFTPAPVILMHGRVRRKVFGQHPPGTPATQKVENAVHYLTHVGVPVAAAARFPWDSILHPLPFRIRQVARIH